MEESLKKPNDVKSAPLSDEETEEVVGGAGEWEKMGKVVQGTTAGDPAHKATVIPKVGGTVPGPSETIRPRR